MVETDKLLSMIRLVLLFSITSFGSPYKTANSCTTAFEKFRSLQCQQIEDLTKAYNRMKNPQDGQQCVRANDLFDRRVEKIRECFSQENDCKNPCRQAVDNLKRNKFENAHKYIYSKSGRRSIERYKKVSEANLKKCQNEFAKIHRHLNQSSNIKAPRCNEVAATKLEPEVIDPRPPIRETKPSQKFVPLEELPKDGQPSEVSN